MYKSIGARTPNREKPATKYKLEELFLEVTNACTHRCLHCASRSGELLSSELSLSEMEQIISEAKGLGLRYLYLTGGEPFTRSECTLRLVEETGSNLHKIILTNGFLLNESIEKRLAACGPFVHLEMTTFSASQAIHDRLTGTRGSLARIVSSTANCVSRGIDVRWGFILTRINIDQIEGVFRLAENLGVASVSVSRLVPSGRAKDNWSDLAVDIGQIASLLHCVKKARSTYNKLIVTTAKSLNYEFSQSDTLAASCNAAITRMFVQADGNTLPCPAFKQLPAYFGRNIYATSLRDAWLSSEAFLELRSYSPGLNTPCFNCEYVKVCSGQCRAQQLLSSSKMDMGDNLLCPLTLRKAMSNQTRCE